MQFLDEARRGELWIPRDVSGDFAYAIAATIRGLPLQDLNVHIDTDNGTASVWILADILIAHQGVTTALIGEVAKSAGLILSVACQNRICRIDTEFLYHGSAYKSGADDDRRKAKWFASRTKMPEGFWLEKAIGGGDHIFGCDEAMEWGVVTEISS
jgi:hypothetical protein